MTTHKTRKPAPARQRWLELDALAQAYLALPEGDAVQREQLRQRILRLLAAGWVQFTHDGQAQHQEDVLSRTFREQASYLARAKGNSRLAQAFGGPDNLSDEAKAEFLARRASRAGRQQQTLLTGLLSQWNPARAGLRVFMQCAVRSFLLDLYDKSYLRQDLLNGAPGATPRGFVTDPGADDADTADGAAGPDDWLDAVARNTAAAGAPDAEATAQTEELYATLDAMRDALPAAERALYDSEIRRYSDPRFTDQQQAASLGLGSRNTLYKRREAMRAALRKLMAAAGHTGDPAAGGAAATPV